MKKSEKVYRHSRDKKSVKHGETTHGQTHDDMWMNMFLRDTRCNTLSHAVHVNKNETCANARENARCKGVLFTVIVLRLDLVRKGQLDGLTPTMYLPRHPTLPTNTSEETTNRGQRQHDDDADDMRGEPFPLFWHEARETSLSGTQRRVYQPRRQLHFILGSVSVLNVESTGHSSSGRSAGSPLLPGYSCLPHLWTWRVGSKMSSQLPGPKWLTSPPTAHHTGTFHMSTPHNSLTSQPHTTHS